MEFLSGVFSGKKFRFSFLLLAAVLMLEVALRFAYIYEVGRHPFLNLALPQTDLFIDDLMAKNLIHSRPFETNASIYPVTFYYIALIYRIFGTGAFCHDCYDRQKYFWMEERNFCRTRDVVLQDEFFL